jgi:glycosyl transferase family 25
MNWPIFIISLPVAQKRRKAISAALTDLGLPFEFVDAIDGRINLPPQYEGFIDRDKARIEMGRNLTDGEFACALSHQKVYKILLDQKIPRAIILEDDAIPLSGFKSFLEQNGPEAADLILFDYDRVRIWRKSAMPRFEGVSLHPFVFNPFLSTGYSISYHGAEYLRTNSLPITRQADWPCDIVSLGARITIPRLIDHPEDKSTDSFLEQERNAAEAQINLNKAARYKRFGKKAYWVRWIKKRLSVELQQPY